MISDAYAAAATAASGITYADVKEFIHWFNVILAPLAVFLWKLEKKMTQLVAWSAAHEQVHAAQKDAANTRFSAFEQRMNQTDGMVQALAENRSISNAAVAAKGQA